MREAFQNSIPVIYFLGTSPGRYTPVTPAFIQDWDPKSLKVRVAFGVSESNPLEAPATSVERRYALRTVQQRLHQASFREAVIAAYDGRCPQFTMTSTRSHVTTNPNADAYLLGEGSTLTLPAVADTG